MVVFQKYRYYWLRYDVYSLAFVVVYFFAATMAHVVWHTYLSRKDGMHSDGWICYHVLHHLHSVPWSILIQPGR